MAATATAMLCRLIILPITPPLEFAAAISTGLSPSRFAVTTCRLPNRALAEVSLPVRKTPILKKVLADDPTFQRNPDFLRDMFNVAVGICWQIALVALPIYIVIRDSRALIALAVVLVTSAILKFTWYDHLRKIETHMKATENRPVGV